MLSFLWSFTSKKTPPTKQKKLASILHPLLGTISFLWALPSRLSHIAVHVAVPKSSLEPALPRLFAPSAPPKYWNASCWCYVSFRLPFPDGSEGFNAVSHSHLLQMPSPLGSRDTTLSCFSSCLPGCSFSASSARPQDTVPLSLDLPCPPSHLSPPQWGLALRLQTPAPVLPTN